MRNERVLNRLILELYFVWKSTRPNSHRDTMRDSILVYTWNIIFSWSFFVVCVLWPNYSFQMVPEIDCPNAILVKYNWNPRIVPGHLLLEIQHLRSGGHIGPAVWFYCSYSLNINFRKVSLKVRRSLWYRDDYFTLFTNIKMQYIKIIIQTLLFYAFASLDHIRLGNLIVFIFVETKKAVCRTAVVIWMLLKLQHI